MTMFLRASAWQLAFEGDDDAAAAAAKAAADAKAAAASDDDDKKFTQEEVNAFVATEKRKLQEKQRSLANELEGMKKEKNLTAKQKGELQQRIDDLQSQYLTTEEKARQDAERKQKEYDGALKTATTERDEWKMKHESLVIGTEIATASIEHDAIHFEQISALLSPRAKLTESLDEDGQPTGSFEPRISFPDTDKDGGDIVLELSINDAVKRMRELKKYQNLFHTDKKGGLGSTGSTPSGKKVDLAKIARTNPKEYRRLRKEQPELLGR